MRIRYQDREIIHYLSLLGSAVGAFMAVFVVLNIRSRAQHNLHAQTEQLRSAQCLLQIDNNPLVQERVGSSGDIMLKAAREAVSSAGDEFDAGRRAGGFWSGLSKSEFAGACLLASGGGALAAYSAVWVTTWLGSFGIYKLVRLIYRLIRYVSPDCAAAKQHVVKVGGNDVIQRDNSRILPVLIKLLILLCLALGLLCVVVWHLTAINIG